MIRVGLTGNMGSGKTTVAEIFGVLKVPVYHADKEAKRFLNSQDVVNKLSNRLGNEIMTNGLPDRKKIAEIVFNDPDALDYLNSLIHPLVREDLKKWMHEHQDYPYIIHEAAILFESGFYRDFDKIITVVSPIALALSRLTERDKTSIEHLEQRMKHQWDQEIKAERSDFVIYNDEEHLVIPQVLEIHKILSK